MSKPQVMVQNIGDVVVVNLGSAAILDTAAVEAIGRQLYDLVEERAVRKLMLDFSQVKFLSSMMLGVMVRLRRRSEAIGGRLAVFGLRPELHRVFHISRLDRLFDFYDNEREALASFGPPKR